MLGIRTRPHLPDQHSDTRSPSTKRSDDLCIRIKKHTLAFTVPECVSCLARLAPHQLAALASNHARVQDRLCDGDNHECSEAPRPVDGRPKTSEQSVASRAKGVSGARSTDEADPLGDGAAAQRTHERVSLIILYEAR